MSKPSTSPLRIGICGIAGRMGRAIAECCEERPDLRCGAAFEAPGHAWIGKNLRECMHGSAADIVVRDRIQPASEEYDTLISFTLADALTDILTQCRAAGKPVVIGTTGLDAAQQDLLRETARHIPIMAAPNMSVGVNLCLRLMELAAATIGEDSDIEITEAHHRGKKDAPSGTALRMGEVIAETLGRDLRQHAIYGREGKDLRREPGTIGFTTIRAGDIVGEHTAMFASEGERVEITHRAASRRTFAHGALRAALWLRTRDPGLYDMQDVLGLRGES